MTDATLPTEPLRAEHRGLLPHLQGLETLTDEVDRWDADEAAHVLGDIVGFLRGHLVPHARAEEQVLYPAVEEAMAAPGATATMRADHAEIVPASTGWPTRRPPWRIGGPTTPWPGTSHTSSLGCPPSCCCTSARRRRCCCRCSTPRSARAMLTHCSPEWVRRPTGNCGSRVEGHGALPPRSGRAILAGAGTDDQRGRHPRRRRECASTCGLGPVQPISWFCKKRNLNCACSRRRGRRSRPPRRRRWAWSPLGRDHDAHKCIVWQRFWVPGPSGQTAHATSTRRDPSQQPTRVLCRRQRSGMHATPQTPGNQRNHQRTSPRVSSIPRQ